MAQLVHELHVHPVVEKAVDLDDVPGQDPALLADPLLKGRETLAYLCHAFLLL